MRISDWSSDVCSSDLMGKDGQPKPHAHVMLSMREVGPEGFGQKVRERNSTALLQEWRVAWADHVNERLAEQIGRASCRERVWRYVSISVVAGSLKKRKHNKPS